MARDKSATGAICLTVGSCYSLWALTWMQIVTAFWFGLPYYSRPSLALPYHAEHVGSFPVTLPVLWLLVASTLAVWAILGVWHVSRRRNGRWRMRFASVLFSSFAVGFAAMIAKSKELHISQARRLMWGERVRMQTIMEWARPVRGNPWKEKAAMASAEEWVKPVDGEPVELWESRIRFARLEKALTEAVGEQKHTVGEATAIMERACASRRSEILALFRKHVEFNSEDVGVIPWREAEIDEETGDWIFRVVYDGLGVVEARLPNWAQTPCFLVVSSSSVPPWSEVLGWRR